MSDLALTLLAITFKDYIFHLNEKRRSYWIASKIVESGEGKIYYSL
jgi:hypothetical protein